MTGLDILHVTSAHPVWDTRTFVKEARSLAAFGFRVGMLGPGDQDHVDIRDEVTIITLPPTQGRRARMTQFGPRLYRKILELRPKAIHIHDPELLIIARLPKRHGIKVVYDVHEEFPKALLSRAWLGPVWMRAMAARITDWVERRAGAWVDGIVLTDTQLAVRFPASKSVVLHNYVDVSEWAEFAPSPCQVGGPIRCIYVGDIAAARGLHRMCDAVGAAIDNGLAVHLDLVGPISDTLRDVVANHPKSAAMTLHGRQDRGEVARLLA